MKLCQATVIDYLHYITSNAKHLSKATKCICICCLKYFNRKEITTILEHENTVVCPFCGNDTVILNNSIVNNKDILISWHKIGIDVLFNQEQTIGKNKKRKRSVKWVLKTNIKHQRIGERFTFKN